MTNTDTEIVDHLLASVAHYEMLDGIRVVAEAQAKLAASLASRGTEREITDKDVVDHLLSRFLA